MAKEQLFVEGDAIIASTEVAARYFGVTAATLSNWKKAGCPQYSYGFWNIKAVTEYRDELNGSKLAEAIKDDPEQMSPSAIKLYYEGKLKAAQLEGTEFRNAINRGDYLERKSIVDDLAAFCIILKRSLNGLGKKISREISPCVGVNESRQFDALITDTINDALEQMSIDGVYKYKD